MFQKYIKACMKSNNVMLAYKLIEQCCAWRVQKFLPILKKNHGIALIGFNLLVAYIVAIICTCSCIIKIEMSKQLHVY